MPQPKYNKITISGQICTGKTPLYRALAKELQWQTYATGQFFRDYAKKHHLSIEKAQEQSDELTKKIDLKVKDLLKNKNQIIVEGWLAGIMANDYPGILKVLLVCSDKVRSTRFARREQVKRVESDNRIKEREKKWLFEIYKIHRLSDIFAPQYYDLVINTTNLTPHQVFQKVIASLYE